MNQVSLLEALACPERLKPDDGFGLHIVADSGSSPQVFQAVRSLETGEEADLDIGDLMERHKLLVFSGLKGIEQSFPDWSRLQPDFRGTFLPWHTHVNKGTALMAATDVGPATFFGTTSIVLQDVLERIIPLAASAPLDDSTLATVHRAISKIQTFLVQFPVSPTIRDFWGSGLQSILNDLGAIPYFKRTLNSGFEAFLADHPKESAAVRWQAGMAAFGSNSQTLHGSPQASSAQGVLLQRAIPVRPKLVHA